MLTLRKDGFSLHLLLTIVTILVVVVLIGLFVKQTVEQAKEQEQFFAARDEVNMIGSELAKRTNPDEHKAVQYCDYGNVTYGRGGRTCWVQYYLLYKDQNDQDAKRMFDSAHQILSKYTNVKQNTGKYLTSMYSNKFSNNRLDCGLYLYRPSESSSFANPKAGWNPPYQSSSLEISCSGEAKAEYFSVKD